MPISPTTSPFIGGALLEARPDVVYRTNQDGQINLQEPLKAPSKWTKFKGALSNAPLLGQIGTLQKARASVADYQTQKNNNYTILTGRVAELRAQLMDVNGFDMLAATLGTKSGEPISRKAAFEFIQQTHKRDQALLINHTNRDVQAFLDIPVSARPWLPGDQCMNDVFREMGGVIPEDRSSWREVLGPTHSKFVENRIKQAIKEHPTHGLAKLSNEEIATVARTVLESYGFQAPQNVRDASPVEEACMTLEAELDELINTLSLARETTTNDDQTLLPDALEESSSLTEHEMLPSEESPGANIGDLASSDNKMELEDGDAELGLIRGTGSSVATGKDEDLIAKVNRVLEDVDTLLAEVDRPTDSVTEASGATRETG